ncbi:MAG TPA: class I SAM-dependent methyltransferase [Clostridia bacterium]|nr:class I SAM-dependent methyltransferase [Clostridia bacterium]
MIPLYESELWRSFDLGHPGGESVTRSLLKRSGLGEGSAILDLCCGAGDSVSLMSELGITAAGVDRENVIDYAKEKYPNLPHSVWFCEQAQSNNQLPFEDQTFDAVLCECSFHLLDDSAYMLDEVRRVLREGGLFLLSDVCDGEPFDFSGFQLIDWQDETDQLKAFVARWMWETETRFPDNCRGSHYFSGIYRALSSKKE